MSNEEQSIDQFLSITGSSREAAAFYLDSAGGDIPAAIDAFFAADGVVPAASSTPASPRASGPVPAPSESPQAVVPPQAAQARRPARPVQQSGRIRGFSDLGGGDDDSEEDEGNEYYAGGEKSGQVVRGGDGKPGRQHVDSLFDRARQAGAGVGTSADLQPGGASGSAAFSGRARTVGDSGEAAREATPAPSAGPDNPAMHTITFWANDVFTVDDGEARSVTDPANRPFLEAIARGECPPELHPRTPNTPININMVRSHEAYAPPAQPRHVAFSGRGQTLAGDAPSSSAPPGQPPARAAAVWAGVDESQPTTSIQIRLADGSRLVARFNTSHTVADIRRFIAASRRDIAPGYRLATAFPPAQLDDDSKTISEAGLANAVVIQKP